jgi:hypothetical protein
MPALDSSLTMNGQDNLQQMNETNFIPLILQAQDLVAKLENRVVELENDLEVCINIVKFGCYLNIKFV